MPADRVTEAAPCHICGLPLDAPGELHCSAGHPLPVAVPGPAYGPSDEWQSAYYDAMQRRDWQECDRLLDERDYPTVPADPVVSPADTHSGEQRENDALILSRLMAMLHELPRREREAVLAGESFRLEADALLAVGERDKAEIERLRARLRAKLDECKRWHDD